MSVMTFACFALALGAVEAGAQTRQGGRPAATTETFAQAFTCAPCHDALVTDTGEELPLVGQWRSSLMAYSFVDPLWRAKVRSEILRNSDLEALIQDKCATCHAPMARTEAVKAGEDVVIFGDSGLLDPDNPYYGIAMEGVGCTLCHQIRDTDELGTPAGASGHYSIADASADDGRRIYAQYANPFQSMVGAVDYVPELGEHLAGSAVCGTCHDLETPYVDASGTVASTPDTLFPEQMPYTEWLHSAYGPDGDEHTDCQGCHMTVAGDGQIANRPPWLPARSDLFRHRFSTENTIILEILSRLGDAADQLEQAIEEGREYVRGAGSVEVVDASLEGDVLAVHVRVTNNTGHKMPTGIPIRRVYLHTVVQDSSGVVVFESGGLNADHSIAGVDADVDPLAFEPHHEVIDSAEEVQVYEGIMRTVEGDVTYTLLRASEFVKDNRLLPRGLDPTGAPPSIAPAGECLNDPDFVAGGDDVTYLVGDLSGERYLVTVELRDQPVTFQFVQDLLTNADDPWVAGFGSMFDSVAARTELIAETSLEVSRAGP